METQVVNTNLWTWAFQRALKEGQRKDKGVNLHYESEKGRYVRANGQGENQGLHKYQKAQVEGFKGPTR